MLPFYYASPHDYLQILLYHNWVKKMDELAFSIKESL